MRSMIRKLSLLTVIAGLTGGVIAAGCSTKENPSTESAANVGFNLDVNGVHINNVHAVITGPGGFSLTQDFDFSGSTDDTIKMNLPVGNGYSITITTDVANCGVTQGFNVIQGSTTNVPLHLNGSGCPGVTQTITGPVTGTVDFQASCPTVYTIVGPNAYVGSKITVHGIATGGSGTSAATSTYAWSGGTFDNAVAADTKFNCVSAGSHVLSVTITGTGAYSACSAAAQVTVTCTTPGGGGTGGTGTGGTATGGTATGGTTGGTATGGTETGGTATGGTTGGTATGGTETGGTSTGGTTGGTATGGTSTGGTTSACGNSVVESGELCDPGFTANNCGANCGAITPAACLACEMADPEEICPFVVNADDFGTEVAAEGPAAGTLRSVLYNETMDCVRDTRCAINQLADCYCGNVLASVCDSGGGIGACKTVLERSLEATSPGVINTRFQTTSFAGGRAMFRINSCQSSAACAPVCTPPAP